MLIPIIYDELVRMDYGTGAIPVNVESPNGYDIAQRHNITLFDIFDESGLIINSEKFTQMKRYECREALIEQLAETKELKEIIPHRMILKVCTHTGDIVYDVPKEQCFLKSRELNEKAADAVKSRQLEIYPERYISKWLEVTKNAKDWCLSRQLWWGHQIPMYKCICEDKSIWVAAADPNSAKMEAYTLLNSESIKIEQDEDVLDPWFTSSCYPLSVVPCNELSTNERYPLSLAVADQDMLRLYVYRMVILRLALTGKLPFNKVLVHGHVCDSEGAKMSKLRGNTIDPDDVVYGILLEDIKFRYDEMHREGVLTKSELDRANDYFKKHFGNSGSIPGCGADSLRFTMLSNNIKANSVNFDIISCYENKQFCNKIYQCVDQAQKYFRNLVKCDGNITVSDLTYFDKWILSRLANMVCIVNTSMDTYDFNVATKALRSFIEDELSDIYMEVTKHCTNKDNVKHAYAHAHTLSVVLNTSLRCLSPYMVHLADELIPRVPGFKLNVIHNYKDINNQYLDFPIHEDFVSWDDPDVERRVGELIRTVKVVRNIHGLYNITSELVPSVYIDTEEEHLKNDILSNKNVILNLTQCTDVKFEEPPKDNVIKTLLNQDTQIIVALEKEEARQVITVARTKLEQRIKRLETILKNLENKYSDQIYLKTVPLDVQLADKERLDAKKEKLRELKNLLSEEYVCEDI